MATSSKIKRTLRDLNKMVGERTGYAVRRVNAPATKKQARPAAATRPKKAVPKLPPARIPEGQARATNFFDDYPAFFETSETTPQRSRLNLRHDAIFLQNRDLFDGARVLDLASHDGRWSFAALQNGARSVVGIEGRAHLVENANETFAHYGVEPDRFRFINGDIFEVLEEEQFDVDVVLCLGFLYHTLRYNELFADIANCKPDALIIDTDIVLNPNSVVLIRTEPWADEWNAITDRYTRGEEVLTGCPSAKALEQMVSAYGFEAESYSDWAAIVRDNPDREFVRPYENGRRVTLRCTARA